VTHTSLVTCEELADLLGKVTVLDVRWRLGGPNGHEEYLRGHVPGAAYVDLESDLADPPGPRGRHPLPDHARFAAAMRRCGVSGDRPVVVYDAVGGTSAARCWWLLRYHGHRDVRMLDGGWTRWVERGGAVEAGEPSVPAGGFRADPGHLPVLDAEAAAGVARDGVLVDARAPERFRGEVEPVDPVAGHIPGAVNVPATGNLAGAGSPEHGRFLSLGDLDARYARAGVQGDVAVGVYCGSGVTAAHDVFALHLLGREAALYPGSWSEWVTDPERPVETGSGGSRRAD
jgi:thiosulfate/3-mercaptopyruvate sulfurtransferase